MVWRGSELVVYERGDDGRVRRRAALAEHAAWVRAADVGPGDLRALRDHPGVVGVLPEGEWVRLQFAGQQDAERVCCRIHAAGAQTFEGDVRPVRRWMTDQDLPLARPRTCYFDLETDSRLPFSRKEEMRVLAWTLIGGDGAEHSAVLEADSDAAEHALLTALLAQMQAYDQACAWNLDRFDLPVLRARCAARGVAADLDRWLWLDQLETFRRMNMMGAESGAEKQSYALQAVAVALFGEGKQDFDASRTWEAWAAGGAERERLRRYCVHDTRLLARIEERTGYVALLNTLCELCNVCADSRGLNPTVQGEGFLLRLARQRGYKFPSRFRRGGEHDKYRGAYVMEPRARGIVRDVHVCDFSAMYPSIIVSWNMSPETLADAADPPPVNHARAPITGRLFRTDEEGILPHAVKEVMRLRKYWDGLKASLPPGTPEWSDANRRSTAYKIAANSFYGVVGSPMSRFFEPAVAESVTQAGAWLLQRTLEAGEAEHGIVAIYGDTDSGFATGVGDEQFAQYVDWCNRVLYPRLLAQCGCDPADACIRLAYEKKLERLIMVSAKRYCARYAHFKGAAATAASKPEVKGLEYKRGDAIKLARDMQWEVVDLLVGSVNGGCEEPAVFERLLARWRGRVLEGELALEDVVISKRLAREIDGYAVRAKKDGTPAKQLPHVEIARVLRDRGRDVAEGAKVDYFPSRLEKRQVIYAPAEDWGGICDRKTVWEQLVVKPTLRLLAAAFPDHDWRSWEKAPKPLVQAPARRRLVRRGREAAP